MTYSRDHHQVIAVALGCLDPVRLAEFGCFFAGGTALAMRFGEYRESVDVDFVICGADGYQRLRSACRRQGLEALTISGQRAVTASPMTIDHYGIRTRLDVSGTPVKFEIIREARIALELPTPSDEVRGVKTATVTDLVAMKLLANSDRWGDPAVFSRDILDLAMIPARRPILRQGLAKAQAAYGSDVVRDARRAIEALLDDQGRLQRCQEALSMSQPRAVVADRLRRLRVSIDACVLAAGATGS